MITEIITYITTTGILIATFLVGYICVQLKLSDKAVNFAMISFFILCIIWDILHFADILMYVGQDISL